MVMHASHWSTLPPSVSRMRVDSFDEIFELLCKCIVRRGYKKPIMKVFSSAMFPTAKKSYESMLSQGIKGTGGHYINIAHIRNVLDFIESRYRMAIKDVI